MLRFDDLQLFVRAADLGSLSAAARGMDMSAAVASAALKRIEQQLGARLLARSTPVSYTHLTLPTSDLV